ncbi:reactive intermediate/imine deaminase [Halorhodospira abdelmalekii]|uniref:RidA family protein n=1 Tax=Halorhodospira abdelmalekii TaxID=421629 RepID=UPI0019070B09|nr:RidA family protein [Halorhodospira abdelmalekii]MBK1735285.1 reactive intermediate/imine deaminase [Halorhodospira abdelmalekii]
MSQRETIETGAAPAAIGPYSQAVRAGDFVFVSGQIPLDPATGELVGADMRSQIERVFANLGAIAEAAGGTLADAVRITVYLTDLSHFALVNEVMADVMVEPYPSRAAVGVMALPKGAAVEMDALLYLPSGG